MGGRGGEDVGGDMDDIHGPEDDDHEGVVAASIKDVDGAGGVNTLYCYSYFGPSFSILKLPGQSLKIEQYFCLTLIVRRNVLI